MNSETRRYFKTLDLVREDVREELASIDIPLKARICDVGCGKGLTTFALALETAEPECIGINKFDGESGPAVNALLQHIDNVIHHCRDHPSPQDALCGLVSENRLPRFWQGDVVLGHNLPQGLDLAYCKRVLGNVFYGENGNQLSGQEGILRAIQRIGGMVRPGGWVCSIEYAGLELDNTFARAGLRVIKRATIERHDVRSRGRTKVVSRYAIYLCQKARIT